MSMIKLAGGSGYGLDIAAENTKAADNTRKVSHKDTSDGLNNHVQQQQHDAVNSEASKVDKDVFEAIMEELKQELKMEERQVDFSFNPDIRQMVVTVTDRNSGEVIRKIPEEYVLKMFEKFQISGRIEGLLINDKV